MNLHSYVYKNSDVLLENFVGVSHYNEYIMTNVLVINNTIIYIESEHIVHLYLHPQNKEKILCLVI